MAEFYSNQFTAPQSQTPPPQGEPLSRPLVSAAEIASRFTYAGEITPAGGGWPSGTVEFSSAVIVDPAGGTMYLGGIGSNNNEVGGINLVAAGNSASVKYNAVDLIGDISPGDPNGKYVTGGVRHGNRMIFTRTAFYDGAGDTVACGNSTDLNLTNQGPLFRLQGERFGTSNPRHLSGPLWNIPTDWQTILGGDIMVTSSRTGIVNNSVTGFAMAAFWGADVPTSGGGVQVVNCRDWHRDAFGDGTYNEGGSDGADDYYSRTGAPRGQCFIWPNSRTLVFVDTHGYGASTGSSGNPSGCREGSSVGNYPYRTQITTFDLAEIYNQSVRNAARPTGFAVLGSGPFGFYGDCAGDPTTCENGWFNIDLDNGLAYGCESGTGSNRGIDVWTVDTSA